MSDFGYQRIPESCGPCETIEDDSIRDSVELEMQLKELMSAAIGALDASFLFDERFSEKLTALREVVNKLRGEERK